MFCYFAPVFSHFFQMTNYSSLQRAFNAAIFFLIAGFIQPITHSRTTGIILRRRGNKGVFRNWFIISTRTRKKPLTRVHSWVSIVTIILSISLPSIRRESRKSHLMLRNPFIAEAWAFHFLSNYFPWSFFNLVATCNLLFHFLLRHPLSNSLFLFHVF